ncbi:TauD/TfdA family dioxygenase [Alphaproteobacteria bacterium]|jgi:taurine dioxygenase|nr:TauD/TfdA family dioxygenase [Alphaproteobacteria bacterium]
MLKIDKLTPVIGAEISGIDFNIGISADLHDALYQALLDNLVIFIRGVDISHAAHLEFSAQFGELDAPHMHYPHVEGFERIVHLENDGDNPPDTNSWHTDLTFKEVRPFASVLVARSVPPVGGDTLWSSCYAAYERLPDGMKRDLEGLNAIHDFGDFRNAYAVDKDNQPAANRLNDAAGRFGHNVAPLIATHPVSGRKFLNFNEAFTTFIAGVTMNESNALKTYLTNHMNTPEDQVRWRWQAGDLAMWDNRITMHYAVADYMPYYRSMNRVTVINDRRECGQ